jgi:hypothetical protein
MTADTIECLGAVLILVATLIAMASIGRRR